MLAPKTNGTHECTTMDGRFSASDVYAGRTEWLRNEYVIDFAFTIGNAFGSRVAPVRTASVPGQFKIYMQCVSLMPCCVFQVRTLRLKDVKGYEGYMSRLLTVNEDLEVYCCQRWSYTFDNIWS